MTGPAPDRLFRFAAVVLAAIMCTGCYFSSSRILHDEEAVRPFTDFVRPGVYVSDRDEDGEQVTLEIVPRYGAHFTMQAADQDARIYEGVLSSSRMVRGREVHFAYRHVEGSSAAHRYYAIERISETEFRFLSASMAMVSVSSFSEILASLDAALDSGEATVVRFTHAGPAGSARAEPAPRREPPQAEPAAPAGCGWTQDSEVDLFTDERMHYAGLRSESCGGDDVSLVFACSADGLAMGLFWNEPLRDTSQSGGSGNRWTQVRIRFDREDPLVLAMALSRDQAQSSPLSEAGQAVVNLDNLAGALFGVETPIVEWDQHWFAGKVARSERLIVQARTHAGDRRTAVFGLTRDRSVFRSALDQCL